jgi:hypothetical protein
MSSAKTTSSNLTLSSLDIYTYDNTRVFIEAVELALTAQGPMGHSIVENDATGKAVLNPHGLTAPSSPDMTMPVAEPGRPKRYARLLAERDAALVRNRAEWEAYSKAKTVNDAVKLKYSQLCELITSRMDQLARDKLLAVADIKAAHLNADPWEFWRLIKSVIVTQLRGASLDALPETVSELLSPTTQGDQQRLEQHVLEYNKLITRAEQAFKTACPALYAKISDADRADMHRQLAWGFIKSLNDLRFGAFKQRMFTNALSAATIPLIPVTVDSAAEAASKEEVPIQTKVIGNLRNGNKPTGPLAASRQSELDEERRLAGMPKNCLNPHCRNPHQGHATAECNQAKSAAAKAAKALAKPKTDVTPALKNAVQAELQKRVEKALADAKAKAASKVQVNHVADSSAAGVPSDDKDEAMREAMKVLFNFSIRNVRLDEPAASARSLSDRRHDDLFPTTETLSPTIEDGGKHDFLGALGQRSGPRTREEVTELIRSTMKSSVYDIGAQSSCTNSLSDLIFHTIGKTTNTVGHAFGVVKGEIVHGTHKFLNTQTLFSSSTPYKLYGTKDLAGAFNLKATEYITITEAGKPPSRVAVAFYFTDKVYGINVCFRLVKSGVAANLHACTLDNHDFVVNSGVRDFGNDGYGLEHIPILGNVNVGTDVYPSPTRNDAALFPSPTIQIGPETVDSDAPPPLVDVNVAKVAAKEATDELVRSKESDLVRERAARLGMTEKELQKANAANETIAKLGFPSEGALKQIVQKHSNSERGSLLFADYKHALQLYGSPHAAAGRKIESMLSPIGKDYELYEAHLQRGQKLSIDLVFIGALTFFLASTKPLHYLYAKHVESKEGRVIGQALKDHLGFFASRGISVESINIDGEPGIDHLKDELELMVGIPININPPNQHVGEIERRARQLKEVCRAIVDSIVGGIECIPLSLIPYLVYFAVDRINHLPVSIRVDSTPPNEIVRQRKLDIPTDAPHKFMQTVLATVPLTVKNALTPSRVQEALYLGPTHLGHEVLLLKSWKTARRAHLEATPITADVLLELKTRATAEKDFIKAAATKAAKKRNTRDILNHTSTFDENGHLTFVYNGAVIRELPLDALVDVRTETRPPVSSPEGDSHVMQGKHRTNWDEWKKKEVSDSGLTGNTLLSKITDLEASSPAPLRGGHGDGKQPPTIDTPSPVPLRGGLDDGKQPPTIDAPSPAPLRGGLGDGKQPSSIDSPSPDPSRGGRGGDLTSPTPEPGLADKPKISRQARRGAEARAAKMLNKIITTLVAKQTKLDNLARVPQTRQSSRPKTKKVPYIGNLNVLQAIDLYGDTSILSVIDEISSIIDHKVLEPVFSHLLTKEQRTKILRSKLFLKAKFLPDGTFERLKARLVAGGHQEDKLSFDSLYSPTISTDAMFAILGLTALERRDAIVIDLIAAYLEVPVQENSETYIRLNEIETYILVQLHPEYKKFVDGNGRFCGKLLNSLYGICQGAVNLYNNIKSKLLEMGFVQNGKDPCVFNKMYGDHQVTIGLFVDDMICTGRSLDPFMAEFKTHFPNIKTKTGLKLPYLGMDLDFSTPGACAVGMSGYAQKLVNEWEVHDPNSTMGPSATPMTQSLFHIDESSPPLDEPKQKVFHSVVMSLLYMSKRARGDLLTPTAFLTTRTNAPTKQDWFKLKRVMSYLKDTVHLCTILAPRGVWIEQWIDAAYGVHMNGKSHSGSHLTMGGSLIANHSSKQSLNVKSSCEAEVVAISDMISRALWAHEFLEEQGYTDLPPIVIWEDNQAAIDLEMKGFSTNAATKHIKLRHFFVHDYITRGEVALLHLSTDKMIADIFTKGVDEKTFTALRQKLLNSHSDIAEEMNESEK